MLFLTVVKSHWLSDVMTDAADVSTVEDATYLEAINYFCEVEMNGRLLQTQRGSAMRSLSGDKTSAVIGLSDILQLVSSLYLL